MTQQNPPKDGAKRKQLTTNFFADEFECKCGCGLNLTSQKLVEYLQQIRDTVKRPIKVTSGTRCPTHNHKCGGTSTSDHLQGLAVDIECFNSIDRRALLHAALVAGVPTIGVKKDCIHLSLGYPSRVFTYD